MNDEKIEMDENLKFLAMAAAVIQGQCSRHDAANALGIPYSTFNKLLNNALPNHPNKKAEHQNTCMYPNLAKAIESRQLTYSRIAKEIGISSWAVSKKLSGRSVFTLLEARKLARLLGMSLSEAFWMPDGTSEADFLEKVQ